jgi:DNA modification methylase
LRDYGTDGQLGIEPTPEEYVDHLVSVFREVHRVLRKDGTLWLVIGDSYSSAPANKNGSSTPGTRKLSGLKPKDLVGIPWRVAFAMQSDGWWLRQDIIWCKRNPMPESVTDRCTQAHEYVFLLAKAERYYYNRQAIAEPCVTPIAEPKPNRYGLQTQKGGKATQTLGPGNPKGRNRRDVWIISSQPYREAHFATFPPALVEICILAGSKPGDLVLDPFCGAGTTGLVATQLGRSFIGIELNPDYMELSSARMNAALK